MGRRKGLAVEGGEARWEAERRQGEALIEEGFESAWGWIGPAGTERARRRADFIADVAGLRPGVTCLELGAGTGEFTKRLAASGCELSAVEVSEATAQVCRERVGDGAEILVGNVETGAGLEGRRFDAIVGVSILHHVNLESCLRRTVLPLLRSGGRFAFSEPNMANPQVWAERHIEAVRVRRHTTRHETAFRRRELRRTLEAVGLRVEVCECFDFLHPATPARLVPAISALGGLLERTPLKAIAGSIRVAGSRP
jgi:2-polyprenyl-3-methyl-5-hydroxy-6-metoxy-1,4-benzoquinol methylase